MEATLIIGVCCDCLRRCFVEAAAGDEQVKLCPKCAARRTRAIEPEICS